MRTLVIGTGGREHALARSLSLDPDVSEVHAAPGNPGIGEVATLHDVDPLDGEAVAALADALGVDLVVVGPEAPLVAGVADAVTARGIPVFGPSGCRGPAGGVEGVRQGDHGRGRRPDRRRACVHQRAGGRGGPRRVRAAVRRQGRRPRRRQGRRGHRRPGGRGRARGRAATGWWSRSSSTGPRSRCSRSPTASPSTRCCPRRTSSGSATATRAPTRAAWAPTRRCPGRRPAWSPTCCATCSSRPSTRWRGGVRRSRGCSTPGSR